ncbi:SusF/SusE family outer membrane protein [Flavitalea sp. BT771]|uniref:SusF/SusE family outer membrane protein n=1 Tax=Flavitalea sp. BT771 TaxID=3063329 RepID=UPI0026E35DF6|nr:SusF/SusE family outer membrane protein [Flavitalea sp. BT771]MDO6433606.1 SusF/SusE family outer membrane protein [Flavitalea sp. BT771]MDV6222489.1 SusF/SusE family outer membrane protein [Flavitalea sp. BT771]
MTSITNKIAGVLLILTTFAACKKPDLAGFDSTGEGLVPFALQSPASGTTVALNAATPNATIEFTWTASVPGLKTPPTYKWVAALKTGPLDTPLVAIPSNNNGLDTRLSLRHQQLDSALKAKGIAAGAQTALIWSVLADNGSTKLMAQNTNNITITRFQDGATPFVLLAPSSTITPTVINPSSTSDSLHFNWTRSIPSNSANTVTYKVWFYKDSTTTPLFAISSNDNGKDSVLSFAYARLSDSLSAHGFPDLTKTSNLKWTVTASSGGWTQWSSYTNQFYIQREVKLYIVGGSTPIGWTPANAIRMIQDNNFPGVFFIYVRLIASGGGFKFLSENTDWSTPTQKIYGDVDGSGTSGNLIQSGGSNNISVPADGIYRVVADINQNKYWLQTGAIGVPGLVGAFQSPSQWDPPTALKMAYTGPNQFIRLQKMSAGDEFKIHDGNQWDHSAPGGSKWYDAVDAYPGQLFLDGVTGDEKNLKNTVTFDNTDAADSLVRVIFDGSDIKNLKYSLTKGRIWVIGDATAGGWTNNAGMSAASRPPLIYQGNGVWKGTVTLTAGSIKFIIQQGSWDFSYGTKNGALSYQNADNISIAAAGTYTITVDEYNMTYTVQ